MKCYYGRNGDDAEKDRRMQHDYNNENDSSYNYNEGWVTMGRLLVYP